MTQYEIYDRTQNIKLKTKNRSAKQPSILFDN